VLDILSISPTSSKLYDSCLNSLEENSSCVSNNATAETGVTRTLVAEDLNNKSRSSSVTVTADDTDSSSDQDIVETASASDDSSLSIGGSSSSCHNSCDEHGYLKDQVVLPPGDPSLTLRLASWLSRIQNQGFSAESLRAFIADDHQDDQDDLEEDEEDEDGRDAASWWQDGLIRVFDPYHDLSSPDLVDSILEGKTNGNGDLVGQCTLRLCNGDEVYGTFRRGVRQGRGSISGDNMFKYGLVCVRGSYRDGVLVGEGRAILAPSETFGLNRGQVTLEGIFNGGFLEGPVRGLDEKGNVLFIGLYSKGLPHGPCWIAREGQGWLHGSVDHRGRLTGDNIAFVYPDLSTCILGTFEGERLVCGSASQVAQVSVASVGDPVVRLGFSDPTPSPTLRTYSHAPSDRQRIACDWHLADCYETVTVLCRPSDIHGAGDGLFAARDIAKNTVISYYNGVRVLPGESYTTTSYSYQIYVDWVNTDDSPFIDIPMGCVDIEDYFASLAHKANHSFNPNCRFVASDHPVFGRVPSLQTIKDVKKGEELMSHYKYDTALAPTWYQEAWARFTERSNDQN